MKSNARPIFRLFFALVLGALNMALAQGPAPQGVGLIRNDPGAFAGYTLLSPLQSKSTFLIDMNGRVVKTWDTARSVAGSAFKLTIKC